MYCIDCFVLFTYCLCWFGLLVMHLLVGFVSYLMLTSWIVLYWYLLFACGECWWWVVLMTSCWFCLYIGIVLMSIS